MTDLTIQFLPLPHGADIPLPAYQTAHAAAMDLHAAVGTAVVIEPGAIALVGCGFAMAIPAGYEAQVRPRSGLASKHGLTVVNAPGTIDADYRGEVKVALVNLGRAAVTVDRGMRIAQMVVAPVTHVVWETVTELPASDRGDGGFGSTG
jgi:dUTP pyrophosphatase